jgi:transcriptional regulator with XRE-family HTH domain
MTKPIQIGPLLDQIIKETGLTQEEIAKEIDYDSVYLSQARSAGTKKLFNRLNLFIDEFRKSKPNKEIPKQAETKNPGPLDQDYKDKYIGLLEEQNRQLKAQIISDNYLQEKVNLLTKRLDELHNNQLVSEAMSQAYQEYVVEVFWKLQGKKVSGADTLDVIRQKAVDKLVTFEEAGIQIS